MFVKMAKYNIKKERVNMRISVCIPCYRSANTLSDVVAEIKESFSKREGYEYQIVLVNDGSPDNTFEVIQEICRKDENVIGVNLSKNQGQATAKIAALHYATGDALVYMDDDGQHPSEGIFSLIEKLREGYDVVFARFTKKKHNIFKRVTSHGKKKLAEWMGSKPKGIDTSPFCAWSKFAMESVKKYKSPFPSANAYLRNITDRFADVEVEHRERASGTSGYTLKKMLSLWMNGFINFSIIPLRIASYCGIFCAFLGFVAGIYVVIRKLIGIHIISGYASTIALILFIGGMIMMMLGLIGEYLGRMYMILSNKPQYTIHEVVNYKQEEETE